MWLQAFLALVRILGPLLAAWLEERLRIEAEKLETEEKLFGWAVIDWTEDADDRVLLLERVRRTLWPWQSIKNRAIDRAIDAVRVHKD